MNGKLPSILGILSVAAIGAALWYWPRASVPPPDSAPTPAPAPVTVTAPTPASPPFAMSTADGEARRVDMPILAQWRGLNVKLACDTLAADQASRQGQPGQEPDPRKTCPRGPIAPDAETLSNLAAALLVAQTQTDDDDHAVELRANYIAAIGAALRLPRPQGWPGDFATLENMRSLAKVWAGENDDADYQPLIAELSGASASLCGKQDRDRCQSDRFFDQGVALEAYARWKSQPSFYREAIGAFHKALQVTSKDRDPSKWGYLHNAIGNEMAYLSEWEADSLAKRTLLRNALDEYNSVVVTIDANGDKKLNAVLHQDICAAIAPLAALDADANEYRRAVHECDAAYVAARAVGYDEVAAGSLVNSGDALSSLAELEHDSTTAEQAVAKLRQAADDGYYQKEPLGRAFAQGKLADALSIQAELQERAEKGSGRPAVAEAMSLLDAVEPLFKNAGNTQYLENAAATRKRLAGLGYG